jgi:hypothetical protein
MSKRLEKALASIYVQFCEMKLSQLLALLECTYAVVEPFSQQ